MFYDCPGQEPHSKFTISNQMDKEVWKDPSHAGMRPGKPDDDDDDDAYTQNTRINILYHNCTRLTNFKKITCTAEVCINADPRNALSRPLRRPAM
jgi:hypothetical protein